jgi:uncharacterized membrane protein (UPF0182 family)
MRRAADLPRRRSWLRASGRVAIIATIAFVLVVVVFGRAVARLYIEALWFDGLGQSGVFWDAIRAKFTLFGIFFVLFAVLAGVNVAIADKLAPTRFPTNVHPIVDRLHDAFGRRLRLYRYLIAGIFAVLMALPATAQWQAWLLYRNSQSFGTADAEFGVDVGFYVFELPFLNFVLDWLFFAVLLALLFTVLVHALNGGVVFASPIPSLNAGTRGHVAVLLALLAAVKAADYWVRRYETTNERRGFVQGATYSVVHAQLPALLLLAFVALVTAALYISTLRTESWRLPLISSALWLVLVVLAGYIYPAAVQGLIVNPNQQSREAAYIERNVLATREAMGLAEAEIITQDVSFGQLNATEIAEDTRPLEDVRLLSPAEFRTRFQIDRGDVAGLTIFDLDVDRYEREDGEVQQVLIAARELDLDGVGNRSWQGLHLINTRGCDLVMAPAGRVTQGGRPAYQSADLERPELYFSPALEGYAVAGTEERENTCGDNTPYAGTAGVEMSSFARRLAFGLAFMDYNVVASGAIDSDSQMLWVRNVRDRVEKLAPFLSFDGDPYPVVVDGSVQWVVDGYTSTSRYPYAQAVGDDVSLTENSGISRDANYVRNSVKAVVDAYDGSVTLYVVDPDDPIVQAWISTFPDLFTPLSEMPDELRAHLRYPEDLFRIQTNVHSKYQLAPANFFERQGAWSVAQAPAIAPRIAATTDQIVDAAADDRADTELATETSSLRFIPYYTMFGDGDERDFVLMRPFVPFSRDDRRQELQAFMTASSDPESYGELRVYLVDGELPDGPLTVATSMETDPRISEQITLLQQQGGRRVRFGDLQLVPISDGLLWVRPFYVSRAEDTGSVESVTEYRLVMVSYNNRSAYDDTIGGALEQLFPGLQLDVGDRADTDVAAEAEVNDTPGGTPDELDLVPAGPTEASPSEPASVSGTAQELLARADVLLREAEDQLLNDGDLGAYQDRVDEASALVSQALELLGGAPPASLPEPTDPDSTEPDSTQPESTGESD